MFSKKMYLAPGENLANQVAFKNMGGKMTEFMLKWVPTPNNLEDKEGTHAKLSCISHTTLRQYARILFMW